MKSYRKSLFIAYLVGTILLGIDFLTKSIANTQLPFQERVDTALPFLSWFLTYNTGYHFIFGNIANQKIWAIFGIALVAFLCFSLSRSLIKEKESRSNIVILSIILSLIIGAAGNVLEVLIKGHATDFFLFHPFPWPSNLCDQYINAIIYIMLPITIIKSILDWRQSKRKMKKSTSE
ncbi:MAG TPA: signal peptidase II [Candidatus Marinimicrobia bacterium]|nr:signal peptidase II [Candidatus Neomarinimicrobiota bacterium]HRS51893.1 signal peptidase II [Candidatus Neomarinimicrobiota bacterium]HRU93223.1 signal peptidase II [Candidatus Neomarinimicrobiota bacterium]